MATTGIMNFGVKALHRQFEGIELHEQPQPGDVTFTYHTYRGLVAFFVQEEHHIAAPPDDALRLLKRLLKYNCTRGMLCPGCVFIPVLSIANYAAQKKSIQRQIAAMKR